MGVYGALEDADLFQLNSGVVVDLNRCTVRTVPRVTGGKPLYKLILHYEEFLTKGEIKRLESQMKRKGKI